MAEFIALDQIKDNPYQPRQHYTDIEALAGKISIMFDTLPESSGLIHIPTGRRMDNGTVELAEGHRRLRAFRHLAATDNAYGEMPVNIIELTNREMDDIAWDENKARVDLNPVEEARALKRTLESRGLTQAELGDLRQLGRSTVANALRLLRLPDDVLEAVAAGRVSKRVALDLLPALEIAEADLPLLAKAIHNMQAAQWSVPSPEALKKRILDEGQPAVSADQTRKVVEAIKRKVEEAKKAKWEAAQAPDPPPQPQSESVRARTSAETTDASPQWREADEAQANAPEADPAPAPPPPPPPKAAEPARSTASQWTFTVSVKALEDVTKSPVMISIYKNGDSVGTRTTTYGDADLDAVLETYLEGALE